MNVLQRWLIGLRERLSSSLYRNAFYLLGGTAITGAMGFLFWMGAARLMQAEDVGVATSVIASSALAVTLSDLGMATAMIHFVNARYEQLASIVNAITAGGWIFSMLAAIALIIGVPLFAPNLAPVVAHPSTAVFIALFTVGNAILLLQDATALALRRADYVFWRNIACNVASPLLLIPAIQLFGDYRGLLLAYCLPNIVVCLVTGSAILPRLINGYRLLGSLDLPVVRDVVSYGIRSYLSNMLWGLPTFILPILALNAIDTAGAASFFVVWTIVNFVLIIPRSVTLSLFVEGERNRGNLQTIVVRTFGVTVAACLPPILLLWFAGHLLLGLFGKTYVNQTILHLLLLSVIPFTMNSLCFISLRVRARGLELPWYCAFVLGCLLSSLWYFGQHSGEGLALGWLTGQGLGALLALVLAAYAFWFAPQRVKYA